MAGQIDEFDLIARLFAPLAAGRREALGLLDDVALIDGPDATQWAVSCDTIVAGVHFLADDPPDLIARKLVRVNLSDLAAMGAVPKFILMTCAFPKGTDMAWLDCYAAGLKDDCQEFSVVLIGGDTVSTPGPLTLSLTALGELPAGSALLRSSARSGQQIWVSGTIGDGAFGLLAAKGQGGLDPRHHDALLDRYRLPRPRTTLGPALRSLASAAMDVSDGLVADLGHICDCSDLGAEIEAARVPLSDAASAAIAQGWGQGMITALTGGDDYEILFTAAPNLSEQIVQLGQRLNLRLTPIGRIIAGKGVRVIDTQGQDLALERAGYNHFAPGSAL